MSRVFNPMSPEILEKWFLGKTTQLGSNNLCKTKQTFLLYLRFIYTTQYLCLTIYCGDILFW